MFKSTQRLLKITEITKKVLESQNKEILQTEKKPVIKNEPKKKDMNKNHIILLYGVCLYKSEINIILILLVNYR